MDITTIFDQVLLVSLDISIWSGRKKLQPSDLHLTDSQIPPHELASIGSKKIVDPKTIAPMDSARRAAEKACLDVGFRFMKGFCIPLDRAKELSDELANIKKDFMNAKATFISNYTNNIDEWIVRHPGWEQAIRKAVTPKEVVENRIGFRVQFTRIGQVEDTLGINDDSQDNVENIPMALMHEIAKETEKLWAQSLAGRTSVTQKILRPIRRMRDKLNGLSFIDARIYPVVERIDASLSSMPQKGRILGNDLNALYGIMSFLQDPSYMLKHGEQVIANNASGVNTLPVEELELNIMTPSLPAVSDYEEKESNLSDGSKSENNTGSDTSLETMKSDEPEVMVKDSNELEPVIIDSTEEQSASWFY